MIGVNCRFRTGFIFQLALVCIMPANDFHQGVIGRNELCPCGSGRKFKRCCMKKQTSATSAPSFSWMDDEELHLVEPGSPPSPEQLKKMTEEYQKRIRKSPMWNEMVRDFGKVEAERLLSQCQAKIG
jgi:hypothetical protein